jgi:hypothetical protein
MDPNRRVTRSQLQGASSSLALIPVDVLEIVEKAVARVFRADSKAARAQKALDAHNISDHGNVGSLPLPPSGATLAAGSDVTGKGVKGKCFRGILTPNYDHMTV